MSIDYRELLDSVTKVEVAFGTTKHLPEYNTLPAEFREHRGTKWNRLFSEWFFNGLSDDKVTITPKDGVDMGAALRFIGAHMASWEPKHEHKEAGVAYMMSQLFDDVTFKKSAA